MTLLRQIAFASALTLASLVSIASGHAHEIKLGELVIHHPWSRVSPMKADVAAGFMTITNTGKTDDRLVKASAEIAGMAQIHDMQMQGDVMKMQELAEGLPIPAGATVVLKPKSLHIMFMGLKEQLQEGEVFSGTLTFEKAGTVTIDYEVMGPAADHN